MAKCATKFDDQALNVIFGIYSVLISMNVADKMEDKLISAFVHGYFWEFRISKKMYAKQIPQGTVIRNSSSPEYRKLNTNDKIVLNFVLNGSTKPDLFRPECVHMCNNTMSRTVWNSRPCPVCNTAFILERGARNIKIYKHSTFYTDADMATHVKSAKHIAHRDVYTELLYDTVYTATQVKLAQDVLNHIVSFM